jgi:cytidine diphosphoramidate kinase
VIFWIIGLAGAGKTTIAKALYTDLKAKNHSTVLLDGDAIREIMGGDLGFTLEDRRKNGWRICRMCKYLDDQGINVVCATLSQFHEQQAWNREHLSDYYEVFVDVAMEVLIRRDQKGLYSGALAGKITNVVGMDMPFPPPEFPDLTLKNSEFVKDFSLFVKKIRAGFEEKYPDWKDR